MRRKSNRSDLFLFLLSIIAAFCRKLPRVVWFWVSHFAQVNFVPFLIWWYVIHARNMHADFDSSSCDKLSAVPAFPSSSSSSSPSPPEFLKCVLGRKNLSKFSTRCTFPDFPCLPSAIWTVTGKENMAQGRPGVCAYITHYTHTYMNVERPRYRIKYRTLYLAKKIRVSFLSNFLDYWYCLIKWVSLLSKFRDYW